MKEDLTTGSIYRKLYIFALPLLFTNLLQMSMQLTDSLWVGNLLGSTAFGAITIGLTVMSIVLAFVLGSNNAILTIFAQLSGKNDPKEIKSYLSSSVILLMGLALMVAVVGSIVVGPLLGWLNTPESIKPIAKEYLLINFFGMFFLVGYNFVATVLRAFGDSKTPLYFILVGALLNAVLDPIFIKGLNLGLAGAAYATVIVYIVIFLVSLYYVGRKYQTFKFRFQKPRWVEVRTILQLSIPSITQMIVIHAGSNVILSIVNSFGESTVAGFGAAQRLNQLILLPASALGTAVNTMAAQNIEAKQWNRVFKTTKVGLIYNAILMALVTITFYIWAEPLVRLFIQEEASVAFGTLYVKTIAFFYLFIGLNFILNGVVRGSGAMFQVLMLNIISLWVLRVPLTYFFSSVYGEIGIPLGMGSSFFLSCLFSIAYYKWGNWREKELFR
ncbi:MATE family efflux transporter [Allobacillus sp. GCM10007491]|uniref:MATE family efflux transporter n=1 Tax=Allobacillus saliphilus TaxID=2912308 RepID=A0A941CTV0_9BACI|nr:MATE family efflux transporter [Allobacillus saliphilus]MBR7553109.1 MATE family efflux transporter [Allobacillus saliphilus]